MSAKRSVLSRVISVIGLAIFSFIAGAFAVEFETQFYKVTLKPAFTALDATWEKNYGSDSGNKSLWWQRVNHSGKGVVQLKEEKSFPGYTAFTSRDTSAKLIDRGGKVVHQWSLPFREAWPNAPHVKDPVEERHIKWGTVHVFRNGDLLVSYTADGDTPYGYGLVKVDKDSNLIWKLSENIHHDFTVNEDGTIWALSHSFIRPPDNLPSKFKQTPILADFAIKLSPNGEVLKRISLAKPVLESEMGRNFRAWHSGQPWDLLHTNTLEPLGKDFAEHHKQLKSDYLVVSFKTLNTIAIIDPTSAEVVWFKRGPWVKQHDPDPMPNGQMMVFDNLGGNRYGGVSRIVDYSLKDDKITWSYGGSNRRQFISKWGGKQQPLPNGNVLITSTLQGRLFEVTRQGKIVWDYFNPDRARFNGKSYISTMGPGVRWAPDYFNFLQD